MGIFPNPWAAGSYLPDTLSDVITCNARVDVELTAHCQSCDLTAKMSSRTISHSSAQTRLSLRVAILLVLGLSMATSSIAKQTITPVPQVVQAAISEVN